MKHTELEKKLSKIMLTRRLIEGGIALVLSALSVVINNLRETDNSHSNFLAYSLASSITFSVAFFYMLLIDCILCKFRTTEKCDRYLTVYRGMVYLIVYVDGREIRRIPRRGYTCFIEAWITAEVRATVNFTHSIGCIAYISYSDHSPSVEI